MDEDKIVERSVDGRFAIYSDISARFWEKVQRSAENECWPWQGSKMGRTRSNTGQYGGFRLGKMRRAHRVAWELVNGDIPAGMLVRHKCDNPICVNPAHLELGTHAQNVRDRYERGRENHRKGESHPNAKLSEADVIDIRNHLADGFPIADIAKTLGLPPHRVKSARDNWRSIAHAPEPRAPRRPKAMPYCKSGHAMEGANLYVNRHGYRICRKCRVHYMREARKRKAAL